MARRAGVKINTTIYNKFRGADFSTDPSLVEKYRSPLCTNIIADAGGMPEKRTGWRTLHTLAGRINGIFTGTFAGEERRLVHAGTKLCAWDETETPPVELLTGLPDAKSRAVSLAGKLWIATGGGYLVYDGETAKKVTDAAPYIPTILITREAAGGGVTHEAVNLLTPYRRESFQTDGAATVFTLSGSIDAAGDVTVWVWGEELAAGWSADRAEGTVTFTSAPAAPDAGSADGLVIEYPHTVAGYAERIDKCTILTTFGVGNSDRAVLSGNPDYPNRDWISALGDPTYFPDLGYATVGTEATAIMGYCRVGAYQAIIKADNGQDSTVFLRSAALDADGDAVFSIQPAISGVGGAAAGSFAALLDDPLFLSGTGIHAISTSDMSGSRVTQNRSFYLNARLAEEISGDCEAVVWRGLYLLATRDGHVFVLDGRQQKNYRSESLGDFVYEGYYWENVPARVWLCRHGSGGEELFFGTAVGKLCKFSTDLDTMARFADDGAAISAVWATKYDDDGTPGYFKTMLKRGCCVTLKPYTRSSGRVFFRTDRTEGTEQAISTGLMDIFDWEDIDSERFTFSTDDSPQEIWFNKKVKNYKRLQIIIRNAEANEGFGVYQITKNYVIGNFAKGGGSGSADSSAATDAEVAAAFAAAMEEAGFGG